MFRSLRPAAVDVTAELRELPASHVTYRYDELWLVIGPTGLFVITSDQGDIAAAADLAANSAGRLRAAMAAELAWVPFVDALVATYLTDVPESLACLAVPAYLLRYAVVEGPRTVDDETLERISRLGLDTWTGWSDAGPNYRQPDSAS